MGWHWTHTHTVTPPSMHTDNCLLSSCQRGNGYGNVCPLLLGQNLPTTGKICPYSLQQISLSSLPCQWSTVLRESYRHPGKPMSAMPLGSQPGLGCMCFAPSYSPAHHGCELQVYFSLTVVVRGCPGLPTLYIPYTSYWGGPLYLSAEAAARAHMCPRHHPSQHSRQKTGTGSHRCSKAAHSKRCLPPHI